VGAKGKLEGFYDGSWSTTGRTGRCQEVVSRVKRGRKMASVMKVIVGLEGSRCHHDERPRPWVSQPGCCDWVFGLTFSLPDCQLFFLDQ